MEEVRAGRILHSVNNLLAPNPRNFSVYAVIQGKTGFKLHHSSAHFELSFVVKKAVPCHDLLLGIGL